MKIISFTLGLIFCCLSISFGQLYEVPFHQKVDKSDIIVEGKVVNQNQILIEGVPYTLNIIEVEKVLKGFSISLNEINVLTFGGNLNGVIIFSPHTITIRKGDKGIFFLSTHRGPSSEFDYYSVYAEKQGFYREIFNGRTKELTSQFSKFNGRNTFYKALGFEYNEKGFQVESEQENCLQFRIEPYDNSAVGSSSLLYFNIFVKSIEPIKLKSSSLKVNYNTDWFGQNIISSENLTLSDGAFNTSYLLSTQDITSDVFEIKLESSASLSGLDYLDQNNELLLCTFGVNVQDFDIEDPIYIENTQYETNFYDSNGVLYNSDCGEINVQTEACSPEISSIDVKKSAGNGSVLEILGSGFIHDSAEPGDEWCRLPNDEHRVKFTDVNGNWVAPLEGDYLEWTATKIRVKVPTEGYVNNGFVRIDPSNDEYASTGRIRVCIDNNVFACTCYDTSDPSDNFNNGELYVPFSTYSKDRQGESGYSSGDCNHAHHARLRSGLNNQIILFNIDALPSQDAKNAFIRALNTWRCAIDINFGKNSSFGIPVKMGSTPAGLVGFTHLSTANCNLDNQKIIWPTEINFDISLSWHFATSYPPGIKIDFESAALHEIGHALGLIHTSNDHNIMFPTLDNGVIKRSLTDDDLEGGQFCQSRSLFPIPQTGCGIELLPLTEDCNIPTNTIELLAEANIHVYPNPTINELYLNSENTDFSFSLFDMQGRRIVGPLIPKSRQFTISTNFLDSGIYLMVIQKGNRIFNLKISKL